jgi:hypothetical protein
MMVVRRVLHSFFARLEPSLAAAYRLLSQAPAPNLWGDRDIEHSWVAAHVPEGPGQGLDFGSGDSHMSLVAVRRGFHMTASDRSPIRWPFEHPHFTFVQEDALKLGLPPQSLDLIINCSTVEHLGLGRYGDFPDPDADLDGMLKLRKFLKPTGTMLLTIPIGQDTVYSHLHRVYGRSRLPRLLQGFAIQKQEYWIKNAANRWIEVAEAQAVAWQTTAHSYGLGCFVLTPKETTA